MDVRSQKPQHRLHCVDKRRVRKLEGKLFTRDRIFWRGSWRKRKKIEREGGKGENWPAYLIHVTKQLLQGGCRFTLSMYYEK